MTNDTYCHNEKRNPGKRRACRLGGLVLLCMGLPLSEAQTPEDGEIIELTPYTVTAEDDRGYYSSNALSGTRMQLPLKEIPQMINVVTSQLIEDTGSVSLAEVLQYTPGVVQAAQASSDRFSLRGFTQFAPAVNGVVSNTFGRFDSSIIERVEVVKGPSAALYGLAFDAGGFVNILTKKPQATQATTITASFNTDDRQRLSVDTTGPIGDRKTGSQPTLMYRGIVTYQDGMERGFQDFAGGERFLFAPSLTWNMAEKLQFTVEYVNDSYDQDTFPSFNVPFRNDEQFDQNRLFFEEVIDRNGIDFNINGPDSYEDYDYEVLTAYLVYRLDRSFSIRAMYQYTDYETEFLRRQGFIQNGSDPVTLNTFGLWRVFGGDQDFFRTDLTWRAGGLRLLAGIQYQETTEILLRRVDRSQASFRLFDFDAADLRLNDPMGDTYNANLDQVINTQGGRWNLLAEYAFFEDKVKVFGGISDDFSSEERSFRKDQGQSGSTVPFTDSEDPRDWQAGVVFALNDQVNLFALMASDQRLNDFDDDGNRLPNIETDSFEIGLKFSLLEDDRLNGALSYYSIERSGEAQRDFSQPTNPLLPSGTTEVEGIELELFYSLSENFSVVGGYAYMDAKQTGFSGPQEIYNGATPDSAPEHQFSVWSKYSIADGQLAGLTVGAGLIHVSSMAPFGDTISAGQPFATVPSYTLINLALSYEMLLQNDHSVLFQVNVDNLTDEKYLVAKSFAQPRIARFSVRYTF